MNGLNKRFLKNDNLYIEFYYLNPSNFQKILSNNIPD